MMKDKSQVTLFEKRKVRRVWLKGEWWFSVIDVIAILTDSLNPRDYWFKMKIRVRFDDGIELSTICRQLKMQAPDGKMRETDCANTESLLRVIQSIPSPKAEPFKRWLARIGKERIDEINNPELAMDRMRALYEKKGYPKNWVDKRVRGIAVRQGLTQEWQNRGVEKSLEFAILTNEIMQGTFDMKVEEYKDFKGLDRENLRDHMNDIELILTMLAEATTTRITQDRDSRGFPKLKKDAKDGDAVAGRTRKDIEKTTGRRVASLKNYLGCEKQKQIKL